MTTSLRLEWESLDTGWKRSQCGFYELFARFNGLTRMGEWMIEVHEETIEHFTSSPTLLSAQESAEQAVCKRIAGQVGDLGGRVVWDAPQFTEDEARQLHQAVWERDMSKMPRSIEPAASPPDLWAALLTAAHNMCAYYCGDSGGVGLNDRLRQLDSAVAALDAVKGYTWIGGSDGPELVRVPDVDEAIKAQGGFGANQRSPGFIKYSNAIKWGFDEGYSGPVAGMQAAPDEVCEQCGGKPGGCAYCRVMPPDEQPAPPLTAQQVQNDPRYRVLDEAPIEQDVIILLKNGQELRAMYKGTGWYRQPLSEPFYAIDPAMLSGLWRPIEDGNPWRDFDQEKPAEVGMMIELERRDLAKPLQIVWLGGFNPVKMADFAREYTGRWRPEMINGAIVVIPVHSWIDDDLYRQNQREGAMRANERLAERKAMQDMEAQCTPPANLSPKTRIGAESDESCRCDACYLMSGYCETQVRRLLAAARAVIQASNPWSNDPILDPAMAELRAAIQMGEL